MLTVNPTSLRSSLAEPANTAAAGGPYADPAGFASLLRQTQAAPAPPAPARTPDAHPLQAPKPAARGVDPSSEQRLETAAEVHPGDPATATTARTPDGDDTADPAFDAEPTDRTRALLNSRARAGAHSAGAPRGGRPGVGAGSVDGEAPTDKPAARAGAALAGPAVPGADPAAAMATWLAALHAQAGSPDAGATTGGTAALGTAGRAGVTDATGPAPVAASDAEAASEADPASRSRTAGEPAGTAFARLEATPQELRAAEKGQPTPAGAVASAPLAGAIAAAGAPLLDARMPDPSAALPVPLATPIDAPDFPQALGLQMSVLVRDGIQHAELQLHPADMGPVSVHIEMDGTRARIDFGADVAATRQALEAGLPALAGALQDAGFTLAGGGVSQHARGRGEGRSGTDAALRATARSDRLATSAAAGEAARARRVTVGGVDLYA